MEYCSNCGSRLEQKEELVWWCAGCKSNKYANPKPANELLLYRGGKLLTSQRAIDPGKGKFDMPGGFIELHETAEEALTREVEEELGISEDSYEKPRYLRSYNTDYLYGDVAYKVLVLVYISRLHDDARVEPRDDVAALDWITEEDIDGVDWSHDECRKNAVVAFTEIINKK